MSTALAIYLTGFGLIFVGLSVYSAWHDDCDPMMFAMAFATGLIWPILALWGSVRAVRWLWLRARKGAK